MPMKTNPETGLPEYDPEIEDEDDEVAALKAQITTLKASNAALATAIDMLTSTIKSGEQWSETLQKEVDAALGEAPPEAPTA
jgi:prefoldin subunit 5